MRLLLLRVFNDFRRLQGWDSHTSLLLLFLTQIRRRDIILGSRMLRIVIMEGVRRILRIWVVSCMFLLQASRPRRKNYFAAILEVLLLAWWGKWFRHFSGLHSRRLLVSDDPLLRWLTTAWLLLLLFIHYLLRVILTFIRNRLFLSFFSDYRGFNNSRPPSVWVLTLARLRFLWAQSTTCDYCLWWFHCWWWLFLLFLRPRLLWFVAFPKIRIWVR